MIGAALPRPPVGIVVALGVAWRIGLSIASFGAVGTIGLIGLIVLLGLGMALFIVPSVLFGRFIMWFLRKRQERHR